MIWDQEWNYIDPCIIIIVQKTSRFFLFSLQEKETEQDHDIKILKFIMSMALEIFRYCDFVICKIPYFFKSMISDYWEVHDLG